AAKNLFIGPVCRQCATASPGAIAEKVIGGRRQGWNYRCEACFSAHFLSRGRGDRGNRQFDPGFLYLFRRYPFELQWDPVLEYLSTGAGKHRLLRQSIRAV